MTDMEILQLADQCGVVAITKHEWDGKQFNHTDDCLDGDGAALVIFAKAVAQHEREAIAQMIEDAPALMEFAQNDQGGCLMCGFTPKLAAKTIRARGQA
jgi:hypothetical protein